MATYIHFWKISVCQKTYLLRQVPQNSVGEHHAQDPKTGMIKKGRAIRLSGGNEHGSHSEAIPYGRFNLFESCIDNKYGINI